MTNPESPFKKTALKGMRALVCGASRGIGRAAVKAFADAGASVVACSRNEEALNQLVESLPGTGHQAVAMDLEKLEVVEMLINKILEDGPIHILINNAAGPPGGPLLENEVEDFEAPFKRHLHAAHTITRMLAPEMEKAGIGRIVNIISTSVKEPIPNIGLSNTLRGAMAAWSKTLSREIAPCITINNILPGFTNTDRLGSLADSIHQKTGKSIADIHDNWISQVPIERLIQPEETADAILFLCLPGSGGIRGVSLAVDGGRLRSI
ncbi:MAG: SDR family oxidoreductase [Candidatus Poseidoniales archaeon]